MANTVEKKKNIFQRIGGFFVRLVKGIGRKFKEMFFELKKVTWPTKKDMINYSIVVLVFIVIMGVIIGVIDLGAGKLVELLVGERVRLINDHQVKIGARAHLTAGQRTDRAKTNTSLWNVKRHRLASLLPQLFEAIHGQIRTSLTFRRTIAVHAVGIRLTHIHETLFKTINR